MNRYQLRSLQLSNKKGKLPPIETANPKLMRDILRGAGLTAVIASENPVERYDEERKMVVKEVLLMEGMELRGGRNQLPIVDSHNDRSVRNIFGSIRNIRVEGSQLVGETSFATDEESRTIEQRMQEGHITDFSISADILASEFIQRGQSYTTSTGQYVEGPAVIVTHWMPYNASICATGADEQSTVRRSYTDLKRKVIRMDEALLSQLSAMGLPEGMTDPNQVLAWVVGKMTPAEPVVENMAEEMPTDVSPVVEKMDEPPTEPPAEEEKPVVENSIATRQKAEAQIKRALDQDQARRKEIRSACELAKLERAFADELCDGFVPVSDARKRIIERMATQPLGSSVGADVRVTASGDDKFYAAARDGLAMRISRSQNRTVPLVADPSQGYEEFERRPLDELAKDILIRSGAKVDRLTRREIIQIAMGNPRVARQHNVILRSEGAYHTTGTFANLLLDVGNKSLLAAYEEAPYTWTQWARTAPSVADLKPIYRTRVSEFPNLEMVPENADYPEKVMSDSKETYTINKYGASFTMSWELFINDDLDALGRMMAKMGDSARRTQNSVVYGVLTANANMGDGNPLFSSSHASGDNTSGAAAAPSVTTFNAAFLKMRKQTGLNTSVILNITPRYLIVPAAYESTALEVLGSLARPEVGGSAAGNSNTHNIYGPGGARATLQVVADAILDGNSATNWYLAADPTQVDTVEVTFLQGEESPFTDTEENFDNDTIKYKVRQTFGAKAIDWRGLYVNKA
jgi:hypothetical protein